MRCLYVDLDGTLLGPDASLLRDGEGRFELLGVRALEACFRTEVEVVIYSGRRQAQVAEDARLIGMRSYVFEAGAGFVLDGELEWLTGGVVPGEKGTIFEQIEASGAPRLLLEHYAGRLDYHAPWHLNREVSHLFRGEVDAAEADALLREHGHEQLRLVDNGSLHGPHAPARGYHLVPAASSKAAPWPGTCRRVATSQVNASRWATPARIWRPRTWSARSGSSVTRCSAIPPCAKPSRAARTCASPRRATGPASTRP